MTDALLHLGGRLHPVVLHLPIGVVAALLACEGWAMCRRRPLDPSIRGLLVWLFAASAVVAAATGLLLAREAGYAGDTLERHRWLGVGIAVGALGCGFALTIGRRRAYAIALVLVTLALIPAGHLGGSMTHGSDFLTGPIRALANAGNEEATAVPDDSAYAREIRPILDRACIGCHGAERDKGKLRLHTIAALRKGGEGGPLWIAGNAAKSEIIRRLRLPMADEQHMPPDGKPQLAPADIEHLAAWIDASASFTARAPRSATPAPPPAVAPAAPPTAAPTGAILALRTALAHVETIDPASGRLWIDFRVRPKMPTATIRRLLEPLLPFVEDLSLAGTTADDSLVSCLDAAPHLRRLDLSRTAVTADGLQELHKATALESLNIVQTAVGDSAVDAIAAMPALRRIYVWRSKFTETGLATLRGRCTALSIDTGSSSASTPEDAALETEPPVELPSAKRKRKG